MKKYIAALGVCVILTGCAAPAERPEPKETKVVAETVAPTKPVETEPKSDTERLGVSNGVLKDLEKMVKVAGYDYTREDFENIEFEDVEDEFEPDDVMYRYIITMKDGKKIDGWIRKFLVD